MSPSYEHFMRCFVRGRRAPSNGRIRSERDVMRSLCGGTHPAGGIFLRCCASWCSRFRNRIVAGVRTRARRQRPPRPPGLRSGRPAYRRGAVAVRKRLRCAIGLGVSTLFLLTLIACVDPLWRPDDHGDTPEAATDMEPEVAVSGRLETAADVDYFRVATGAAGVRVVASTDSQDTMVRIEGLVAEVDQRGPPGLGRSAVAAARARARPGIRRGAGLLRACRLGGNRARAGCGGRLRHRAALPGNGAERHAAGGGRGRRAVLGSGDRRRPAGPADSHRGLGLRGG